MYLRQVPLPQAGRLTSQNTSTEQHPQAQLGSREHRLPLNLPLTSILAALRVELVGGAASTPADALNQMAKEASIVPDTESAHIQNEGHVVAGRVPAPRKRRAASASDATCSRWICLLAVGAKSTERIPMLCGPRASVRRLSPTKTASSAVNPPRSSVAS